MKRFLALALALVMIFALAACGQKEVTSTTAPAADAAASPAAEKAEKTEKAVDPVIIKISQGAAATSPVVLAETEVFKTMVEEGTEGRYIVDIYTDATLGDDTKSCEGVREGSIEMFSSSPAPMVGLCPELAIFDIPFLFTSAEKADKVVDGEIGQYLNEKLEALGIVNLAWCEFGFRNLSNSAKEVHSPADLEGLKIRTQDNKYHLKAWELFGAIPTPMSFGELFTALQQKTVDGQENPIATIYSSQFYTVNKYISTTEHIYTPLVLAINKDLWETISPEDQAVFREAAQATAVRSREINRAETENYIKAMEEAGTVVTRLTAEEKAEFQALGLPVWDMVEENVGSELIAQLKEAIK